MASDQAYAFFQHSRNMWRQSRKTLDSNYETCITPYYSEKYHALSVLYPVIHIGHALRNLYNTLEGLYWLVHALFNDPKTSIPVVLEGMAINLGTMILNCVNAIASVVNLITRTVSTIFNLGYERSAIMQMFAEDTKGKIVDSENSKQTSSSAETLLVGAELMHFAHSMSR